MNTEDNINSRLYIYVLGKKFISSVGNLGLFTLSAIAILSIGQLVINPSQSLLLEGNIEPTFWASTLLLPVMLSALSYSLVSTYIELNTHRILLSKEGVKTSDGLLHKINKTIPYSLIEKVESKQTLIQKLLGFKGLYIKYGDWKNEEFNAIPDEQADKLLAEIAHNAAEVKLYQDESLVSAF